LGQTFPSGRHGAPRQCISAHHDQWRAAGNSAIGSTTLLCIQGQMPMPVFIFPVASVAYPKAPLVMSIDEWPHDSEPWGAAYTFAGALSGQVLSSCSFLFESRLAFLPMSTRIPVVGRRYPGAPCTHLAWRSADLLIRITALDRCQDRELPGQLLVLPAVLLHNPVPRPATTRE
jgi:hypothetical protein